MPGATRQSAAPADRPPAGPICGPCLSCSSLKGANLPTIGLALTLIFTGGAAGKLACGWLGSRLGVVRATMGLYDPAFATLTRLYGHDARSSITGITLIAGFASTIGWPLSAWLEHSFGWRDTCLAWAALNLFVAMPLNWLLIPPAPPVAPPRPTEFEGAGVEPPRNSMLVLAFFFAAAWFVTG